MGKSTLGDLLARRGVAVLDTDRIARQIVEPGRPALAEIVQRFGPSILRADNTLNREALGRRVFSDDQARADLEAILHPRIHAIWTDEVNRWRNAGSAHGKDPQMDRPGGRLSNIVFAVIIPLLFETNSSAHFDATICVVCSDAAQARRLGERGWNAEQIRQRIRAQWPIGKKIAQSDYVIWTDTPLDAVGGQLDKILKAKPFDAIR